MQSSGTGIKSVSQTGLVCISSVDDYFKNVIKKHELTRPEKEKDRIDHMKATRAQTGNVFLAYRDVMEVNALINGWKTTNKPVYDFTADDGIQHIVWIINREAVIDSITGPRGTRKKNLQTKDSNTSEKGCVLCHFAACNLKNRH